MKETTTKNSSAGSVAIAPVSAAQMLSVPTVTLQRITSCAKNQATNRLSVRLTLLSQAAPANEMHTVVTPSANPCCDGIFA